MNDDTKLSQICVCRPNPIGGQRETLGTGETAKKLFSAPIPPQTFFKLKF